MSDIKALIERLEKGERSNELDIAIEIALFDPKADSAIAVRANHAGTKLVYTEPDGTNTTCLAWDWSDNPARAAALLRAKEGT